MSTFKLDTSQPIRRTPVKKVTRHGTRVRGIERKSPHWYGPNIHIVEWNIAQQPRPMAHRVPEDPSSYREEVEK